MDEKNRVSLRSMRETLEKDCQPAEFDTRNRPPHQLSSFPSLPSREFLPESRFPSSPSQGQPAENACRAYLCLVYMSTINLRATNSVRHAERLKAGCCLPW